MNTQRIILRSSVALVILAGLHLGWPSLLVPEAQAVIGRPATPLSVAGVARRTAVRSTAAATSASKEQAAAAQKQAADAQKSAEAANKEAAAANAEATAAKQEAANAQQTLAAQQAAAAALPAGTKVSSLPAGCTSAKISGVDYFNCSGTYYKAVFDSTNVVYIVSMP
jgi:nucleoid-associated protein YgaU